MDLRTMFTWWPPLVMGWPALGASLLCAVGALLSRKPRLMIAAAVIASPFCLLYALRVGGPFILACYFGAVTALGRNNRWLATGFLMPFVLVVAVLAHAVLTQPDRRRSDHATTWHAQGMV